MPLLLPGRTSEGAKTHFRHKENEGKESHRAHVGTGIAFPQERLEHPSAARHRRRGSSAGQPPAGAAEEAAMGARARRTPHAGGG